MIPQEPVATIVIPLLAQRNEWLRQSLLSALQQTLPCQVIVVISPDTPYSNRRLLQELEIQKGDFIVQECLPDQKIAGALNTGFRLAACDRVGILLSDDWLAPTAVEACLGHRTDIVSTGCVVFSEDSVRAPLLILRSHTEFDRLDTDQARANYLEHFFLFNREKLLEVGGVDESVGLTGADDYDLVWTLLEHGASVALVEQGLYFMRDHGRQRLTLRPIKDQRVDLEKILDKHNIHGKEREYLLREHSRWFGRKIFDVLDDPDTVAPEFEPVRFGFTEGKLAHNTGEMAGDAVLCSPEAHKPGHCLFGPNYVVGNSQSLQARFLLELQGPVVSGHPLVTLDVYDSRSDRILVSSVLVRPEQITGDFSTLAFSGEPGQHLEFRAYWHGNCTIRASGVILEPGAPPL